MLVKIFFEALAFIFEIPFKILNRFLMYIYKFRFNKCGDNVKFYPLSSWFIYKNISIGNDVFIGERASFKAYIAKICIGNKVMFGPNVTIRGGIHPYYVVGRFMFDIGENEKSPNDDQDVVIEDDVWVGTNVTILKGVTLGRGSIVAAGAVVTKNIMPYSINGGIPSKKIANRFKTVDEVITHENKLYLPSERIPFQVLEYNFNL